MGQRVGAQRTVVDRDGQLDRHDERLDLDDLASDTVLGQDDLVSREIAHRPAVRSNTEMTNATSFVLREEQGSRRQDRRQCERRSDGSAGAQARSHDKQRMVADVAWALRYSKTPAHSRECAGVWLCSDSRS